MSLNFDEFNSVVEIFDKQSSTYKDKPYLWRKSGEKTGYEALTWQEVRNKVEADIILIAFEFVASAPIPKTVSVGNMTTSAFLSKFLLVIKSDLCIFN